MSCQACSRLRFEVAASGVDDGLQGLSSDPYQAPVASGPGLRVPAFTNTPTTRFLFLLATRQVQRRTRIRGLGQLLTIGTDVASGNEGTPPFYPIEWPVTTPSFRFVDGNVSWHLVLEPNTRNVLTQPTTNSANFCFCEADGPALLYQTATYGVEYVDGITGAPGCYPVGMEAYTPPTFTRQWQPLGGLGCFYDLRFPYDAASAWNSLDIDVPVESNVRVSLYATVLQTGGNVEFTNDTNITAGAALPPEYEFIYANGTGWPNGVYYWRVGGRIMFEDELSIDCACESPRGAVPSGGGGGRTPQGGGGKWPSPSGSGGGQLK